MAGHRGVGTWPAVVYGDLASELVHSFVLQLMQKRGGGSGERKRETSNMQPPLSDQRTASCSLWPSTAFNFYNKPKLYAGTTAQDHMEGHALASSGSNAQAEPQWQREVEAQPPSTGLHVHCPLYRELQAQPEPWLSMQGATPSICRDHGGASSGSQRR